MTSVSIVLPVGYEDGASLRRGIGAGDPRAGSLDRVPFSLLEGASQRLLCGAGKYQSARPLQRAKTGDGRRSGKIAGGWASSSGSTDGFLQVDMFVSGFCILLGRYYLSPSHRSGQSREPRAQAIGHIPFKSCSTPRKKHQKHKEHSRRKKITLL